jgi:predicted permease
MRLWHVLRARARLPVVLGRREKELGEGLRSRIDREIDALMRDIRHAVRTLGRDWRFSAAAVVILGLGIGANTAIFSLINAALFRQQSFADPDRLVDIYQNAANAGGLDASSYPAYLDMAAYTSVFAGTTAASVPRGVRYMDGGVLRPAVVEHTTATYLSVLGLRPSLGRWFSASEDAPGAPVVAVVGYQAWTTRFQADPSVVGRTVRIEGVPVTIVGVGPAGHRGTIDVGIVTDFWLPISSVVALGAPPRTLERRPEEAGFFVKARLRDGVTVAQARAAMRVLGSRLAAEYPKEDPGKGIAVFATRDVRVHPQMDAVLGWAASVLLGVVGLVLAIACSNLATLLLVRGAARAKEVSVRLALGATRRQLVRHLLTESLLLSAAGGFAGCILAWWGIRSLGALDLPIAVQLTLDYRVLTFALALSLFTGVAFGLAPALKASRVDLVATLRDDGETRSSGHRRLTLKDTLVVFQVAVSVVLLSGTGIFLQMLNASRTQRVGFAVDGVAMLETDARYAGYSGTDASNVYEELRWRVAAIPGVQSAALARGLPMQTTGRPPIVQDAGAAGGPVAVSRVAGAMWAGPGYFETLHIPILYGRAIDERDRRDTPRVAVISETMARQYFGTANAVGRRFRLEQDVDAWLEVIGVARDTGTADLQGDLVDPTQQLFYRSFAQWDLPPDTVLARTSLDATGLVGAMQREMRAVDVTLPVISAKTMAQYLDESLVAPKTLAALLGGLGALGLCLAGIGLYAVVAFAVSRRSREIGIRMALGARSRQVVWTVTRDLAVLVGVGTGVGLFLSVLTILALRAVAAPAPGISLYRPTADPAALIAIAAFMAAVGVAAASRPAWRAATMDPLTALRRD